MKHSASWALGLVLTLSSCSLTLLPEGTKTVHLSFQQTTSRTIDATTLPVVKRYELTFTPEGGGTPVTATSATGSLDLQLAAGNWGVLIDAYDAATGGNLIGQNGQSFSVVNGPNTVILSIYPVTLASGNIQATFDWSPTPYGDDADSVVYSIRPWSPSDLANNDVATDEFTETASGSLTTSSTLTSGTFNAKFTFGGRSTLTLDAALKSGTYLLTFDVRYPQTFDNTTHTELVKVYDQATSAGHVNPVWQLSFDGNDVSVSGKQEAIAGPQGFLVNLPPLGLSRGGYLFGSWNTVSGGGGQSYAKDGQYPIGTSDATLYAQWKLAKTISFDANGGTGTFDSLVVPANETTKLPMLYTTVLTMTNPYHYFAGWSTAFDQPVSITNGQNYAMGGSDVTLYAQWKAGYGFSIPGGGNQETSPAALFGSNWGTASFPAGSLYASAVTYTDGNSLPLIENAALREPVMGAGSGMTGIYLPTEFRISGRSSGALFAMNSFDVYNNTGSNQTLTIQGWASEQAIPVPATGGFASTSVTVVPGWQTVTLSTAFMNMIAFTVDFDDNLDLYFNNFDLYPSK